MEIPGWISNIFNQFDTNGDGTLSKTEIGIDREKAGIGSIYQVEEGMNIEQFITQNKSVFTGYVQFEDSINPGRYVMENEELVSTNEKRNKTDDTPNTTEVGQGQYVIKSAKDCDTLQTCGIGPCVAITIYDKTNKQGFLAHIDMPDKANDLSSIIQQLRSKGFDLNNCEARIIGGQTGQSETTIENLQTCLNKGNVPIVEMDVLGNGTRAIQLDLNTGEVSDYNETIHNTSPEEAKLIGLQTFSSQHLNKIQ